MKSNILYIFTRTPLHVGAGNSVGAIDQPVMRERHTGFPIIPGSSIKGVFADCFLDRVDGKVVVDEERNNSFRDETAARIFGLNSGKKENDQGNAGSLSFGEARILAFPVRSAKGCFAWLTSPLAISRWMREQPNAKTLIGEFSKQILPENDHACYDAKIFGEKGIFEDLVFEHAAPFDFGMHMAGLSPDPVWSNNAKSRMVMVSDEVLSHFCQSACEVAQHVVIDDETGTAKPGLLFNQENVPAETLFFSTAYGPASDFVLLAGKIGQVAQFGGDATTGLGLCSVNFDTKEEV